MTADTIRPTYHISTLGCEKNSVDSEGMAAVLEQAGYAPSGQDSADVLIVNTCGFLQASTDESVGVLGELDRRRKPGQLLVAAGCASHRYGGELKERVAGIDALLSTRQWPEIAALVDHLRTGRALPSANGEPLPVIGHVGQMGSSVLGAPLAPVQPTAQLKRFRRKATGPSAYVKISEGCDHKCAFCIIPAIRGKHVSRPVEEIAAEVADLAEQGVKEVVLIAQDSTYYGIDMGMRDGLAHLFDAIAEQAPGIMWVRLMYAYPTQLTPGMIEAMARHPQVAKYIDIPLQHAHPDMLKRMKRPNDVERNRRLIGALRDAMPDIAIRTTFIVGYPGETDDEFRALTGFLDEIKFDNVGMFTYSPEKGTPAADLPGQVPEKVKLKRYREAMLRQQKIATAKNRAMVGRTVEVLVDGEGTLVDGKGRTMPIYAGRTYRQAPEVDGMVFVRAPKGRTLATGDVVQVQVTESTEYDLWGKVRG
jgi:ribosomal protein S12 methylthiotransferase